MLDELEAPRCETGAGPSSDPATGLARMSRGRRHDTGTILDERRRHAEREAAARLRAREPTCDGVSNLLLRPMACGAIRDRAEADPEFASVWTALVAFEQSVRGDGFQAGDLENGRVQERDEVDAVLRSRSLT